MTRRPRTPRTVGELGEFPLIERLSARLGRPRPDVVVGIGDDVAVIETGPERLLVATCDVQVAGVHFLLERVDPRRLGRKAAAVNISDVAASGGLPAHFLSSLVLPADTEVAWVEQLYDGLAEEARRWGADVVGGNVSGGDRLVIDLTLFGEVPPDELLRRDGARPGDRVLVSGTLGAATAGLRLSLHPETAVEQSLSLRALNAFETPVPRVREARVAARSGCVSATIDISDGLAADLGHVCDRSGVGARIDAARVPVAEVARAVAEAVGEEGLAWALGGGEDYEMLFVAEPGRAGALADEIRDATGTPVTEIGEIVDAQSGRSLVMPDGETVPLAPEGWRHF